MPRRLLVPQDDLALPGLARRGRAIAIIHAHQLYAVERWIVDRAALLRLLVVYTADPAHSVRLHVYEADDDAAWFAALALLAAQSAAKPKQTPDGVLMLTSLAHFRSDYTIVLVPDGVFSPPVKHQLYTNINLLRLGASGRTALTLSGPSETTNERFLSAYHTRPALVVALVALVQAALALFGYPLSTDGLLCDATVHAIAHWTSLFASPSERTLDPAVVAALLSLVLCTRNKLAHLGYAHLLAPDPFADPRTSLSPALAAFSQSPAAFIPLTNDLLNSISASFDSRRLSRVIRTRLNSDSPPASSTTDSLLSPISILPTLISIVSSSPDSAPDSLTALWSFSSSPGPPSTTKRYKSHKQKFPRGGAASDGDNARTKKYDGRSTEDESDPVHRFGGSLGHSFHWPPRKVRLRSWAGLTKRKHQSVDLTPSPRPDLPLFPKSPQRDRDRDRDRPLPAIPHLSDISKSTGSGSGSGSTQTLNVNTYLRPTPSRRSTLGSALTASATASASASIFSFGDAGRAQSPTLQTFFGEGDDEDLLSSGQVSPLSDRPNPFYFSLGGSQTPHTAAQHSNSYPHPIHSSVNTKQADFNSGLSACTATAITRNQNLNIDEKMLAKLLLDKGRKGKGKKRSDSNDTSGSGGPSGGAVGGRIASWAGPVSAGIRWANDDDDDEEEEESEISEAGKATFLSRNLGMAKSASIVPPKDWGKPEKDKERARFDSLVVVVDDEGRLIEEEMDSEDDDGNGEESGSEYGRGRRRRRGRSGEINMEGEYSAGNSEVDEQEEQRREAGKRRAERSVAKGELKRRRSYHDLDTFRELEVLSPERMKIDVELCGQCLIMWRRETHLRNVVDCVRLLTSTLSKSNSHLQSHYQSHLPTLAALTSSSNYASVTTNVVIPSSNPSSNTSRSSSPKPFKRSPFSSPPPGFSSSPPLFSHTPLPAQKQSPAHLLQSIDEASRQTERFSQATNTLLYQSEQFDVRGLWNWVGRERRKVWALRGGVFGEGNGGGGKNKNNVDRSGTEEGDNDGEREGGQGQGPGRKLPEGVHGAHGSFNRLQWRLDGRGVLVDELGRTESEAEEEERVERGGSEVDGARTVTDEQRPEQREREPQRDTRQPEPESKDEEIEVEFLDRIKPMWLLKFFTSWGARWSAATANAGLAMGGTSEAVVAEGADASVNSDETTVGAGLGDLGDLGVGGDLNPSEDDMVEIRERDATLSTGGDGGKGEMIEPLLS